MAVDDYKYHLVSIPEGIIITAEANSVSTGNSSTTTLGADATFTGEWVDTLGYGVIFVNIYSDVASATDGLAIEQSSDSVNADHDDKYTIPANTGKNFSINPYARYMRIKYTNGSGAQSSFRLQTILRANSRPSSHRIQDAIIDDDDAELMKAVLTGKADGSYVNVLTTEDGDLKISDNSSGLAIAQGNVTGASFIHKFGAAPDFDTTDGAVTIWDGAEDNTAWENMVYNYSTTAAIDSISSSDAGDTVDIEIQGLDSNYDLVTQTITLNGQNRVALTTNLIRVFRAKNVGSTDLAGHVFVFENDTLSSGVPDDPELIRAVIQPENNQTEMAVYTIPNGYTGYMRDWYATTAGASKTTDYIIRVKARPFGQVFQLKHRSAITETGTSTYQHRYEEPEVFAAKTDIEMTAEMTAAGATAAAIAGGFDIVLVAD